VDVRNVKAIIVGPPDTPYEFGFFEVCADASEPHMFMLTYPQFAIKFGRGMAVQMEVDAALD
jgi:hypothetical protein